MKDLNREQLAKHLFDLMQEANCKLPDPYRPSAKGLDSYWKFMVDHGYNRGYFALADYFMAELTRK